MLTLIEAISLAGDRHKQNDDACGLANGCAWVIDGATDLHTWPYSKQASDALWIAQTLDRNLARTLDRPVDEGALRSAIQKASDRARTEFTGFGEVGGIELWESPIASVLIISESNGGLTGLDLGDCRLFTLAADGTGAMVGGPPRAAEAEERLAAQQTEKDKPLLERTATIEKLRKMRAELNQDGSSWTFGLNPECAAHARGWSIPLKRSAHILLCSDGLSALVDRYHAYDAAGLVRAALDKGLQELGRELRAIEAADAGGAKHPRFKASDDATGLLLRLT